MKIAVITTCTHRKKKNPVPYLCASKLPQGDLNNILSIWKNNLSKDKNKISAIELYSGRGFSEIRKTVDKRSLKLWIVSAGVGLIKGDDKIPAYNLTVAPSSENSIQSRIVSESKFIPTQWWSGLNKKLYGTHSPIYDLIKQNPDTFFIISLSGPYVDLIGNDLFLLSDNQRQRVRLTGLISPKVLPQSFKSLWMPYDERYDGPQGPNPGTRSDFSQRVTRHFIEEILLNNLHATSAAHAKSVTELLNSMAPPVRVKRPSLSDDEIQKIIINRWEDANGSGARMLKILRHQENIACEQQRFGRLFRQIKSRISCQNL